RPKAEQREAEHQPEHKTIDSVSSTHGSSSDLYPTTCDRAGKFTRGARRAAQAHGGSEEEREPRALVRLRLQPLLELVGLVDQLLGALGERAQALDVVDL